MRKQDQVLTLTITFRDLKLHSINNGREGRGRRSSLRCPSRMGKLRLMRLLT